MIRGSVLRGRHAVIDWTVFGTSGRRCRLRAMIDTGFDGWFTLPSDVIRTLKLPWYTRVRADLADGSETFFDVYQATILWDRSRCQIPVNETDSMPLVGMALMKGYSLNMDIRPGGKATLTRLS